MVLDRGMVIRYARPRSYTGEDLVEIMVHGGSLVPSTVLAALVAAGARVAAPGEFTRRAVLNGKLDLVQAEAIADLIDARSRRAQEIALSQLDGGLSRRILELRRVLLDLEAMIAYDIDFPEEDDGPVPMRKVTGACDEAIGQLMRLQASGSAGEVVREGAVVVLAGAPNVGKSSLFNALLGQTRAIVTDQPGTTRDALESVIDIGQWGVRLVDTAGLRQASDEIERRGIEMSERYLARAELVLVCGDNVATLDAARHVVEAKTRAAPILVWTKSDQSDRGTIVRELVSAGYETDGKSALYPTVIVSAETGQGLDDLIGVITRMLDSRYGPHELDAPVLVRERHRRAVAEAMMELEAFRGAWTNGYPPASVAASHLRSAIAALEDVVGPVSTDDVLDRVFAAFCVGK
jgi:tRNA modification GTPase